jgi:hypothetical protein
VAVGRIPTPPLLQPGSISELQAVKKRRRRRRKQIRRVLRPVAV